MEATADKILRPIPARVRDASEALFGAMEVVERCEPPLDDEILINDGHLVLARRGFDFTTPGGVRFAYRNGHSVYVEPHDAALGDEAFLYLWGTVFGGLAWLNDHVALHASAVTLGERTIAFSADSGGGKSTIAAALAHRGFDHVCDDTLVLVAEDDAYWALPDGKPIKLWDDALDRVPAEGAIPIATVPGKHYVTPSNRATRPALLTDLVFLADGEETSIEPIEGGAKLELLATSLYREFIHAARSEQGEHAEMMLNIARTVRFWRLRRPKNSNRFNEEADRVVDVLRTNLKLL